MSDAHWNCTWVTTGIELRTVGLYTGYYELQECALVTCLKKQVIKLGRTLPDNPYCAGKLKSNGACPCHVCSVTRKTWQR